MAEAVGARPSACPRDACGGNNPHSGRERTIDIAELIEFIRIPPHELGTVAVPIIAVALTVSVWECVDFFLLQNLIVLQ